VAVLAVRRAAAAILEHRSRPTVSTKPDGSPVTSADLAADTVIRATVREAFPGDAILTEEGVDVREAGGAATDLAGAPLRYNQPEPRFASGLIVAAEPVLHRRLVAALRRSPLVPRAGGPPVRPD